MTTTEFDVDGLIDSLIDEPRKLILFNDDITPVDLVVNTIVEVCGFPPTQAEQITLIAHYKGKASLKNGGFEELKEMHEKFLSRNILTEIE